MLIPSAFAGRDNLQLIERVKQLTSSNPRLRVDDKPGLAIALHFSRMTAALGGNVRAFDEGVTLQSVTEESVFAGIRIWFYDVEELMRQGAEECIGARREVVRMIHLISTLAFVGQGGQRAAALLHEWMCVHCEHPSTYMDACEPYR